ncbi:MAG TPA: D-alanine--D-alanine ligase [Chloroflexi bacterium]|nr:MAG: D-alanine--D-alanine ligase A [Chloroflexota bacterium]HDD55959.1 D-alanine--D-alanine ligase [Chloroflexota bacterium]
MDRLIRLGVLFGGRSGEHAVSLVSAQSVLETLDHAKYQITQIGITEDGDWLVGDDVLAALVKKDFTDLSAAAMFPAPSRPEVYSLKRVDGVEVVEIFAELDVIFPILHGTFGEDGTMQGLFELNDLAYVGAGVLGSSVGMDKALFKDVMIANQIPVAPSILIHSSELKDMEAVLCKVSEFGEFPVFIKPANMGSSVGVHKCSDIEEAAECILDAARYDRRILVEKGINAREIELSVLGNQSPKVSIPGEIRPTAEFYSYEAKYHDDSSELIIPARLRAEQIERLQDYALRAYQAIDCAGMARADFLLDKETGEIFLNEINTIPGFTPISMYPKLWKASGLSYADLIDELIRLAIERKREKDQIIRKYDYKVKGD